MTVITPLGKQLLSCFLAFGGPLDSWFGLDHLAQEYNFVPAWPIPLGPKCALGIKRNHDDDQQHLDDRDPLHLDDHDVPCDRHVDDDDEQLNQDDDQPHLDDDDVHHDQQQSEDHKFRGLLQLLSAKWLPLPPAMLPLT